MKQQRAPGFGCCGVAGAAVAVNHRGIRLANESAVEGFCQQAAAGLRSRTTGSSSWLALRCYVFTFLHEDE